MFIDFQVKLTWTNCWKWIPLRILSLIYSFIIRLWLFSYRFNFKKSAQINHPIISIGNITVGGTGKTPMIDWFLDFLGSQDIRAAVISRGYKAKKIAELQVLNQDTYQTGSSEQFGDEPWFLYENHPQDSFYISSNRILAAEEAKKVSELILLDDGMQHLKIHRDLNLVLIDSVAGVGNGHIIPLGPLREPIQGIERADAIIYTRTNLQSSKKIRKEIQIPETIPTFDSEYQPIDFVTSKQKLVLPTQWIQNKYCILFSGIGNPSSFTSVIENLGAKVTEHLVLQDHQEYDEIIFEKLMTIFQENPQSIIITTEKDWTKVEKWKEKLPNFYRLRMKTQMPVEFEQFLKQQLQEYQIIK
ncbi:MAG: tetraacyldisaccharide 4'-kinase [bacterium]|jgi:tetraacyldisaccharide 4'-kinase